MDSHWSCFWNGIVGLLIGAYGWYWINRAKDMHIRWLEGRVEYWHSEYVQMRDRVFEARTQPTEEQR